MSITSKMFPLKHLCTFIVAGKISLNEIEETIKSYYKKQSNNKVLWDFRYSDPKVSICSNEIQRIASSLFRPYLELHQIEKTAIVAPIDLWFSFARMYAKFTEIKNISHLIQIFRFMDEAVNWLGSE